MSPIHFVVCCRKRPLSPVAESEMVGRNGRSAQLQKVRWWGETAVIPHSFRRPSSETAVNHG
ncbi:MAG: hypothetical protein H6668_12010 [Ardenticatenaceae bacterium]|nr:hypothetical protein [Ardenticatenaceae bacterium]